MLAVYHLIEIYLNLLFNKLRRVVHIFREIKNLISKRMKENFNVNVVQMKVSTDLNIYISLNIY